MEIVSAFERRMKVQRLARTTNKQTSKEVQVNAQARKHSNQILIRIKAIEINTLIFDVNASVRMKFGEFLAKC